MSYTTHDLVEAVLAYCELTLPPALRQGPPPELYEITQAKNKMTCIAIALNSASEEITR